LRPANGLPMIVAKRSPDDQARRAPASQQMMNS
jgi:hypothetical protein